MPAPSAPAPSRRPHRRAAAPDDVAVLLSKLGHRAKRLFAALLEPLDLKPNHVQALTLLRAHPGASQRDLVATMRVTPSTIVELLDEFETRGLAERRRNAGDRRASAVHLTRAGGALLTRALAISAQVEDQLLAPLATADRDRLHAYLQTLDQAYVADP